jgi:hypothetical protein
MGLGRLYYAAALGVGVLASLSASVICLLVFFDLFSWYLVARYFVFCFCCFVGYCHMVAVATVAA